jgi:hypothetical protein
MWKVAWILVAALRMILNFFLILYLRLKRDSQKSGQLLLHVLDLLVLGGGIRLCVPSLLDGHGLGEQTGASLIFEFGIL